MVARALDAKLQLALDAPVAQAMVRTAPSHGGRVAVMVQTAHMAAERLPLETDRLLLEPIELAHAEGPSEGDGSFELTYWIRSDHAGRAPPKRARR
jgi:hypothetical protein